MNEYTLEDLVMDLLRKENDESPRTDMSITARGGYCIHLSEADDASA